MMKDLTIIDANSNTIDEFGICGYKNRKHIGYRKKIEWSKERFKEGMKFKVLQSESGESVGAIEYIPGNYSWRPIEAKSYMVIHCIYIMKREFKEKGYGMMLLNECISDAKKEKYDGIAVVTRKGSWMAGNVLFLKAGFELVDKSSSDFELLVMKFNKKAPDPFFIDNSEILKKYEKGLTMFISQQCPYVTKAVIEISETAEKEYGIKPKVIDLKKSSDARKSPCPFGVFCIVYNGKVVAEHPISNTRFKNIMNKLSG